MAYYLDTNPFPIPNSITDLNSWLGVIKPNAIVLSGGNDFGQFPCEILWNSNFLIMPLLNPFLGICRGCGYGSSDGAKLVHSYGHTCSVHELTSPLMNLPFLVLLIAITTFLLIIATFISCSS